MNVFMKRLYEEHYDEEFYMYLMNRINTDKNQRMTIDVFCRSIFPSEFNLN